MNCALYRYLIVTILIILAVPTSIFVPYMNVIQIIFTKVVKIGKLI